MILSILLVGGQLNAFGQDKNEAIPKLRLIDISDSIRKAEKPGNDLVRLYKQESDKWKCQPLNTDKRGLGRWGLLLLLAAMGGAVAGGVYAATNDNDNRPFPLLPQLPRGPLKGKFSK